ncbi:MAG: glycosyltransferase family 2 protein [Patescibacteria group bacterium]
MNESVAYIIVCWNNKDLLKECLDAIYDQTYQHKEVYLIDNNSSDGSAQFVAQNYPKVHLVRSKKNNGFARGNNLLINKALRDDAGIKYFALINTDAVLDEEWTDTLVQEIKKHKNVAAAQGITIDYNNRHLVDSHHIYVSENLQSVQHGYREYFIEEAYFTEKVMGVNAAAAVYTRDYIESQPFETFFDEKFFMYLEDVDVSLRAVALGWDNYFVAGAKAYHMGSASSNKRSSDFSLYYTARNQFGLMIKNIPTKTLFRSFGKALIFEYRFIRHLKRLYGAKTQRAHIKGRVVGVFRSVMYISDRFRINKIRRANSKQAIELFMRNKGRLAS